MSILWQINWEKLWIDSSGLSGYDMVRWCVVWCGVVWWCVVCSCYSWPGRLDRQYKSDKFWERTRTKTKTPFRYEAHLFTQAVRSIRVCHCLQHSPSLCCSGQGCHWGPLRNCTLHVGPAQPFGNILSHQTLTYSNVLPSITSKFISLGNICYMFRSGRPSSDI